MNEDKDTEKKEATVAPEDADTKEAAPKAAPGESETPKDPIDEELERARKQPRTEAEKAAFTLKKNADRARELGLKPEEILGFDASGAPIVEDEDDSKPLTRGDLKAMRREEAQKTSLSLADKIEDSRERELTKHYLETKIRPSGDAEQDLKDARALVNSVKNSQIATEINRTKEPRRTSSSSGAPAKVEAPVELTAEELSFTRPPFNMTPAAVIATRPKQV